ncbi:hypothetical protein ACFPRL_32575 [Pseudoclavibacter helvolus]
MIHRISSGVAPGFSDVGVQVRAAQGDVGQHFGWCTDGPRRDPIPIRVRHESPRRVIPVLSAGRS